MTPRPDCRRDRRLLRVDRAAAQRARDRLARLNYGDCFAYALSAESDEPLLFNGDDITHTDVLKA